MLDKAFYILYNNRACGKALLYIIIYMLIQHNQICDDAGGGVLRVPRKTGISAEYVRF